ncbi:MAG: aminotransferase class V-fold PLP-dependent enzyme [Deltaproteobacteria bacterium]|nr:aminotransferase class V-fold PLP-dependent enzyme [Deltaproteobacteria bacterium]
MYFGRIPRFSPSFSPAEALVTARTLVKKPDDVATVHEFENTFAGFIGARFGVMTPSARFAFYLILKAMGLRAGDEVVIPALTYFAIPSMAAAVGIKPVFADVGKRTHVLDPAAFEAAITPRTRAVVPTHLYGTPCDMDPIREIAKKHGIKVIEDCAQSTGARYRGTRVGNLGDAAYYTFGLTKNITTLSGAMITTNDPAVAASVRADIEATTHGPQERAVKEAATGLAMMFATHPFVYPWTLHPAIVVGNRLGKDPIHERFGEAEVRYDGVPTSFQKARPRAVQAAVGMKQIERIEALNGARIRNGRALDEALANVDGILTPEYPAGAEPIYMSFVIHHPRRDALMVELRKRGVDTTVGYMSDCSDHDLFAEYRRPQPNAAAIMREQLHIPVHPRMDDKDTRHIAEAVRQSVRAAG